MRIEYPLNDRKFMLKSITFASGDLIDFGWQDDETGEIMIMESIYIETDKDVVLAENNIRIASDFNNPMCYRFRRADGKTSPWMP